MSLQTSNKAELKKQIYLVESEVQFTTKFNSRRSPILLGLHQILISFAALCFPSDLNFDNDPLQVKQFRNEPEKSNVADREQE
jgi:hypothetical protein